MESNSRCGIWIWPWQCSETHDIPKTWGMVKMHSSSVKSFLKVPLDLDLISVFIFAGLKVNTQSWMKIVVSKPIQPHYLHIACNKFYPLNCHHFLGFVCFRSLRIFFFCSDQAPFDANAKADKFYFNVEVRCLLS